MKVTVDPNGVVSLEVSNGEVSVALDFIEAMRRRAKESSAPKLKRDKTTPAFQRKKTVVRHPKTEKAAGLPKGLFETLKALAQNDTEEGLDSKAIAELNKITDRAAHQRLLKLTQKEYAYRVKPGHYRAVPPPTPAA